MQSVIEQLLTVHYIHEYAETVLQMNLLGNSTCKPRGIICIEPTQIRWFLR